MFEAYQNMEMMLIDKGQDRCGHRYLFLESIVSLKHVIKPIAEKRWHWVDAMIIQMTHNWARMNAYDILGSGLSYLFDHKVPKFSVSVFRIVLPIWFPSGQKLCPPLPWEHSVRELIRALAVFTTSDK